MKKTFLTLALVCAFSASAGEAGQKTQCKTEIKAAPNPLAEIVTLPFKMVAAFSHVPRCLVAYFPTNEEK